MELKTISEVQQEIEKKILILDCSIKYMLSLYDSAARFIKLMNVFIFIIISEFSFFYKDDIGIQNIKLTYTIFASLCTWEVLASIVNRKILSRRIVDSKFNISWDVFSQYIDFNNLNDFEKERIYKEKLMKSAGLFDK